MVRTGLAAPPTVEEGNDRNTAPRLRELTVKGISRTYIESEDEENRVLWHTVDKRQQNALAPNCQVGELSGGSKNQLGLELIESGRSHLGRAHKCLGCQQQVLGEARRAEGDCGRPEELRRVKRMEAWRNAE